MKRLDITLPVLAGFVCMFAGSVLAGESSLTAHTAADDAGFSISGNESTVETSLSTSADDPASLVHPIVDPDGADPFVLKTDEGYLYTKTTGSDITLYRASSVLSLGCGEEYIVYRPEGELTDLWAPELWHLDDAWYIYFAATPSGQDIHHMYVLENTGKDPTQGQWTLQSLQGMDDRFAIDGTVMELAGKRYLIWSGWEGDVNIRQDLYLAEMESPTQVKNEKILLSTPTFSWETIGDPDVNEGPQVLVRNHTVNLLYSASGSWTDDYCLGLLTMDVTADPKNPDNWIKQDQPVMKRKGDVFGPGHACFTVSPDGKVDLLVYHAARWEGSGWIRNVRFGYLNFSGEGVLLPLEPVSGSDLIPVPGGDSPIHALSPDTLTGTGKNEFQMEIQVEEELQADNAKKPNAILVLYVKTEKLRDGDLCTLGIKRMAEDGSTGALVDSAASVYAAQDPQPVFFPVCLSQGKNVFSLVTIVGKPKFEVTELCWMES